jgi:predicted neuraminidase
MAIAAYNDKLMLSFTMKTAVIVACLGLTFGCSAQVKLKAVGKELILNNPPFKACHSSSILEIKPGYLMVAFFAGSGEGQKDVAIWLSGKSGSEWTKPYRIADGVINDSLRYPCWNPVLFRSREGRVFLFYKVGPNPREWWGMVRTSDDDGKTWSNPQKLPDGILGPIKNKPVQLEDGVILNASSVETDSTWKVHVERSDDLGKTWDKIRVDTESDFKVIQPAILFHGGKKLQMVCRSDQDSIVDSWSHDNGRTWSAFSKLALPNPNSGIDAVTLKNGLQVLVYNPEVRGKEWFNNRGKLNVAYSLDGKDWKTILELENKKDREFSYPAIIQTGDGLVHITYTYNRENIKYVRLEVER